MFRLNARCIFALLGVALLATSIVVPQAAARRKQGPLDATLKTSGAASTWVEAFIKTGDLVAERDLDLFKNDLLQAYRVLENDQRNLTRLYMRCDRSWGATAYALALQAASKEELRVVLMNYDAAGRDWEQTAARMRLLSRGGKSTHAFNAYLNRQSETWERILENPMRWRETYLESKTRS
ncbi:MAG: hypothetical protein K2G93_01965 [Rikenella sp.]|nr:hypothetical protein [Rikenella sp.]